MLLIIHIEAKEIIVNNFTILSQSADTVIVEIFNVDKNQELWI